MESAEDSFPACISDTENWVTWNGNLDNPNESKDDCEADDDWDIKLGRGIKPSESPVHRVVSAVQNLQGLISLARRTTMDAEKGLTTVSAMETRRNKEIQKKWDRLGESFFTWFYLLLDLEIQLEKYYRGIVSSRMRINVQE